MPFFCFLLCFLNTCTLSLWYLLSLSRVTKGPLCPVPNGIFPPFPRRAPPSLDRGCSLAKAGQADAFDSGQKTRTTRQLYSIGCKIGVFLLKWNKLWNCLSFRFYSPLFQDRSSFSTEHIGDLARIFPWKPFTLCSLETTPVRRDFVALESKPTPLLRL